ncbi:MAG TPA: DMT family transporter [Beijerinckiaceae bacterium]|nr:DMT family transporter [Beijerinckiaceae bacterium]
MNPRHFAIIVVICLIWAGNTVLSRIIVADLAIPPFFYSTLRFCLVALLLFPWLRHVPRPFWRILAVSFLISGVGFGLFIAGMQDATPSSASIVGQVAVPATTLLSVLVLGETIRWRRITGIALAVIGIIILMYRPGETQASWGLWLIILSSLMAAAGVIVIKQMLGVAPLQYQAWTALLSILPLAGLSWGLESNQWEIARMAGWKLVAALLFVAIMVSIVSHSLYFWVLQRNDANLVAPLMILNPLFSVILGIWITGDQFDLRMSIGAIITLAGVLLILLRPSAVLPLANAILDRFR